jgi:hypothetical protein
MRDEYAQCQHRDEEPPAESFFTNACAECGPLEAAPGNSSGLRTEGRVTNHSALSSQRSVLGSVVGAGGARERTEEGGGSFPLSNRGGTAEESRPSPLAGAGLFCWVSFAPIGRLLCIWLSRLLNHEVSACMHYIEQRAVC